jgi:DNA-directed RNA polymerase subunit F
LLDQANQARSRVVEALSAIAEVVSHAAEAADELKPEEAREAVRKILIAPLKAVPSNGFSDDLVPDATKNLKSILKHEGEGIGDEVEKRIWEQLRDASPDLFPALVEPESHPCGAPCRSHDGRCQRRTSEDYCYQHGDTPGADAQPLAGKWRMSGSQSGIEHSGWEADLTLEKSGTAKWHQTQGANAGAKRTGRWQCNRGIFTLVYRAPHTGRVEWQARVMPASANSMGGDYRTPEVAPVGTGWGGTWSASRTMV